MKILFVLLASFIFNTFLYGQKPDCERFHYGSFMTISDSLLNNQSFKVIRTFNEQVEINSDGQKLFFNIQWISNCSYKIWFNNNSNKLQSSIRDKTVLINLFKTSNDTAFYKTFLIKDKKHVEVSSGRMVKMIIAKDGNRK